MQTSWVLVDESAGAAAGDGSTISPAVLAIIAEAVAAQLNGEFAAEYGGTVSVRAGASPTDVQPGELVCSLVSAFDNLPGASAYHDDVSGQPVAYVAVTTCGSLYGPTGVSVDISHELCEAQGDPGCNELLDDESGQVHANEKCDAVEVQTYAKTCADGTEVQVSNFLLRAWTIPGAGGPFDYMTQAGLAGAVAPAGPMQTAAGDGGNYQIVAPFQDSSEGQVFSAASGAHVEPARIVGTRRKGQTPHWASRAGRRLGLRRPTVVDG
jgi:hypothetical protein